MSDSSGCRDTTMKMNKLMWDQNVGTRFIASTPQANARLGIRQTASTPQANARLDGRDLSHPYTHIRD